MTVRTQRHEKQVIHFCTITCHKWLPLFERLNFYDHIYNWFKILKAKQVFVTGYVIMPNHLHVLLYLPDGNRTINQIIANAKRFMAYDIVARLKSQGDEGMLALLASGVPPNERVKGKKHQVFEPSFDVKPCYSEKFVVQKLNYVHHNPVRGKWNLVDDFALYPHSSAGFYVLNKPSDHVTHYQDAWEMAR